MLFFIEYFSEFDCFSIYQFSFYRYQWETTKNYVLRVSQWCSIVFGRFPNISAWFSHRIALVCIYVKSSDGKKLIPFHYDVFNCFYTNMLRVKSDKSDRIPCFAAFDKTQQNRRFFYLKFILKSQNDVKKIT